MSRRPDQTRPVSGPRLIVILGAGGQVGRALGGSLAHLGRLVPLYRGDFDPANPGQALSVIRPDLVVNAAAWTMVDAAESRPDEAAKVNADLPAALAKWAAGRPLVHYSTDYVFDGFKLEPYLETDRPDPLSVYGRTKLSGDEAVLAGGGLVLRTSWVYSLFGRNFPKTILELAAKRRRLDINDDQSGAPTSAELIAQVTATAAARLLDDPGQAPRGLYNLTATGAATWLEYAKTILQTAQDRGRVFPSGPPELAPVYGPDPARPAPRPLNSRLDCSRIVRDLGVHLPHWTYHLERMMADMAVLGLHAPAAAGG